MRVMYGATRLVFLIKDKAIKVGRMRPWRFLARMLIFPFSRKRRKHFFLKYGPTFWQAARNDLCAGLYANRNEYEYYFANPKDCRVMPTIKKMFRGWVVIQTRGEPVSSIEFSRGPFIRQNIGEEDCEVMEEKQFCRHPDGRIVLVDYGRRATIKALSMSV